MTRQGVHTRKTHSQGQTRGGSRSGVPKARTTADEAAWRFVRDLDRLDEAKGLRDELNHERMGAHLARAFEEIYGEDAYAWAAEYSAVDRRCAPDPTRGWLSNVSPETTPP